MKTTLAIQERLIALGFYVGPKGADGIPGRNTTNAIARFQQAEGLDIKNPGSIGPKTLTALGLDPASPALPWVSEGRRFLGLHEVRDARKLDKALRLDASEIAWCGGFLGMVIATALPSEAIPANPLSSRNWLKFGRSIEGPQIGAVAVFWRGSKIGWRGHVGIVVGHDKTHLHILGGNQSNSVSISRVSKDRLLGHRWPRTYALPTGTLAMSTISASVTTNEA